MKGICGDWTRDHPGQDNEPEDNMITREEINARTGGKALPPNVVLWTEECASDREKLHNALKSATEMVRRAYGKCSWVGPNLMCHGDLPREMWTAIYFWLSGYGDCLFVNPLRKTPTAPI